MALEPLDDALSFIIHHKPSPFDGKPYLIARTVGGHTVKGRMTTPAKGQAYRFWGEWVNDRKRGEVQFEFTEFEPIIDQTDEGIALYLSRHMKGSGIGEVLARRIVNAWGLDTLTILRENPARLLELKGFSQETVDKVRKHFESDAGSNPAARAALMDLFSGNRIPNRVIEELIKQYQGEARAQVVRNPYQLLDFPRVGWKTVDPLATTRCEYPKDGIFRQAAAIWEAFQAISLEGHTYATRATIDAFVYSNLIGMRPRDEAWQHMLDGERIVTDSGGVPASSEPCAIRKLDEAERSIARDLARLAATAGRLPFEIDDDGLLEGQTRAVRMIESNGVCCSCGGAGTGKTYSITRSLRDCLANGYGPIYFAAPTGKAAKRGEELLTRAGISSTDVPATTIHRMLKPIPNDEPGGIATESAKVGRGRSGFKFGLNRSRPINAAAVILDEGSMIDVSLMADTLDAIPNGCRLVVVGDPNQLPSVGPGSVLRDMMDAGLPSNVLTEIQRSSGRIVRACHEIMAGRPPRPSRHLNLEEGENWIHIEIEDPAEIADEIVQRHAEVKTFDPFWGMQVVSPQKSRLPIACENLNNRLSELLNPGAKAAQFGADDGPRMPFHVGDKVVRTKNGMTNAIIPLPANPVSAYGDEDEVFANLRWDGRRHGYNAKEWLYAPTEVVNGDMGTVLDIVETSRGMRAIVKFILPDRLVALPTADHHLQMAYALTCHKAQGSGFPYVIVPVHHSFYYDAKKNVGLFTREWLYTAFSRAEKVLVTVGPYASIESAVRRKTIHRRKTRLKERIRDAFERFKDQDWSGWNPPPSESEEPAYEIPEFPAGMRRR
jgi:exodeoxyribonuclease V alpha subunit